MSGDSWTQPATSYTTSFDSLKYPNDGVRGKFTLVNDLYGSDPNSKFLVYIDLTGKDNDGNNIVTLHISEFENGTFSPPSEPPIQTRVWPTGNDLYTFIEIERLDGKSDPKSLGSLNFKSVGSDFLTAAAAIGPDYTENAYNGVSTDFPHTQTQPIPATYYLMASNGDVYSILLEEGSPKMDVKVSTRDRVTYQITMSATTASIDDDSEWSGVFKLSPYLSPVSADQPLKLADIFNIRYDSTGDRFMVYGAKASWKGAAAWSEYVTSQQTTFTSTIAEPSTLNAFEFVDWTGSEWPDLAYVKQNGVNDMIEVFITSGRSRAPGIR